MTPEATHDEIQVEPEAPPKPAPVPQVDEVVREAAEPEAAAPAPPAEAEPAPDTAEVGPAPDTAEPAAEEPATEEPVAEPANGTAAPAEQTEDTTA